MNYRISYSKMVGGVLQHFVRDVVADDEVRALKQGQWLLAAFDVQGWQSWLFESCVRIERVA